MTLQDQIGAWHRATFGDRNIRTRILAKFKEESREFLETPTEDESADCLIVLMAYADRQGWDLIESARTKFAEVKARGASQIERDKVRGIA